MNTNDKYLGENTSWEKRYSFSLAVRNFFAKYRKLIVFGVIPAVIVAICVCTLPIVKDIDITLNGYEIHFADEYDESGNFISGVTVEPCSSPIFSEPRTLNLKGKLYKYLIKQDYYEGEVNIDGFAPYTNAGLKRPTREEDFRYYNKFKLFLNEYQQWLAGPMQTDLVRESTRDSANIVYIPGGLDLIVFQVMVSTSPTARSSAEQFLVFPAASAEEAAGTYWNDIWAKNQH